MFDEWRRSQQQREAEQRREHAELLRLAGLLSKEEAVLAKHGLQQDNRDKARAIKAEVIYFSAIYCYYESFFSSQRHTITMVNFSTVKTGVALLTPVQK